jgi:hypothetical protein
MTGIDRGYSILKDQLDEYLKDLEANKERGLGDFRPIRSQDPSLAAGDHELAREAEDAIRAGQQKVRAALRRLGAASDISETGSMDLLLSQGVFC